MLINESARNAKSALWHDVIRVAVIVTCFAGMSQDLIAVEQIPETATDRVSGRQSDGQVIGRGSQDLARTEKPLSEILAYSAAEDPSEAEPVSFSTKQIKTTIVSIAFLFGVITIWNRSLRKKVASRSSSLAETTIQMRTAFEAVQEAVLVTDANGIVRHVNRKFDEIFGFQPQRGSAICGVFDQFRAIFKDPELLEAICYRANERSMKHETAELETKDGGIIRVYTNVIEACDGDCHGRLWTLSDITSQRRLELDVLQAKKSEAIGLLSGGIAHDFNNFLTVIRSSLAMIEPAVEASKEKEFVDVANVAVDRAADLTQQLLGYARKSHLEQRVVSANQLVQGVVRLLSPLCGPPIELQCGLAPEGPAVQVDQNRFQQAIMNVCLNSLDALRESGGKIEINVCCIDHVELGSAVQFSISDDGPGIPTGAHASVFEPFFTTKDVGEGTGLGLSVAEGIINQHGGSIECVASNQYQTEFRIFLPRCTEEESVTHLSAPLPAQLTFAPLKILLVDDEPLVRQTAASLLENLGHTVGVASNGMEALRNLVTDGPFDVVVLDLVMPEMSGIETLREIRSEWRDQPVVICTAYADNHPSLKNIPASELPPIVGKPYQIDELQRALLQNAKRQSPLPPFESTESFTS